MAVEAGDAEIRDEAAVAEERVGRRVAPAEGAEDLRRVRAAAKREDCLAEAAADLAHLNETSQAPIVTNFEPIE